MKQVINRSGQIIPFDFSKIEHAVRAAMQSVSKGYVETYGLVYALDARIPVYKVYRAYVNKETHNMCVFDPS